MGGRASGPRKTDLERFNHYDVAPNGCWLWNSGFNKGGYGEARYKGKKVSAHRMAACLFFGLELDDPRWVLHRCDTPKCVNPDHLFLGTNADNMRDCVNKKRHPKTCTTQCPKGHPYSGANVLIDKRGYRRCRTCCRLKGKQQYRRKVARESQEEAKVRAHI
jgi:HNH endonuclease